MEPLLIVLLVLIAVFVLISLVPIDATAKTILYLVAAIGAIAYLFFGK